MFASRKRADLRTVGKYLSMPSEQTNGQAALRRAIEEFSRVTLT